MGVEADVQRTGDPQQPGAGSDAPCPFPLGICSSASHGRRPWMRFAIISASYQLEENREKVKSNEAGTHIVRFQMR